MVAILVLIFILMVAASLISLLSTENKLAGHNLRGSQALNTAEAGVSEAISRIAKGDVPNNGNPRMVVQIFLTSGSPPTLGPDSVALATAQQPGAWLDYSTPSRSTRTLTIQYKTDAARTKIYRYDRNHTPPIQTVSGCPIFTITSSGRQGRDIRSIQTDVVQNVGPINIIGALAASVDVTFTGNAVVCGYNHRSDTPVGRGSNGRSGAGGCNEDAARQEWEVGSGNEPGIWSSQSIGSSGASMAFGIPAWEQNQTGFYAGPWEALGMSKAEFFSWVGPPRISEPGSLSGVFYLDNNATTQDRSGDFEFHSVTGAGFLYVDGNLTLDSDFIYRGLIYIEGDLKLSGNAWVLGGVVVRGTSEAKIEGGATVLYSHDGIIENLARGDSRFTTLSWREAP